MERICTVIMTRDRQIVDKKHYIKKLLHNSKYTCI